MALKRVPIPSPNYSSRGGAKVRLVVVHTAEGARTYRELGNFFANRSSQVSSHTGIDDTPGTVGEYVQPAGKAWTAANYNPVAVQTELCAFARWDAAEWNRHPRMLENCAAWIAEECKRFGLPIVKLTAQQAQGSGRGVCGHVELGPGGGGHWDPGPGFPWAKVIAMAKGDQPGGGADDVDAWVLDWLNWYLTTDRKPAERPKNVPAKIPDSAWQIQKQVEAICNRFGMTDGERQWIVWKLAGEKGKRPAVPAKIPDRWWPDHSFVIQQRSKP